MCQSIKCIKLSIPKIVKGSEKVLLPHFTKRKRIAEDITDILEMTVDQHEGDGIKRQGFSSSLTDQNWHLRSDLEHSLVICISQWHMMGIGLTSVGLQETDFTQEVSQVKISQNDRMV